MTIDFGRVFRHVAERFRDHEAVVHLERGRRYTFLELHRVTNRIVNAMRDELGLRRGDVYLDLLDNESLSLFHLWTVFKGEATAAWTNFRDSFEEHRWQVERVRPKAVFLENALLDRYEDLLRSSGATIVCMDPLPTPRRGVVSFDDLIAHASDADPGIENDARRDVVFLRFTGGTTGKGKCAEYAIDHWLAGLEGFYAHPEPIWREGMRLLHFAPMSHGTGMLVLPTAFRGGTALVQNAPDLTEWCRNVQGERATHSMMVPTLLYRLLELDAARAHDLSSLETIVYGAAPMSPTKLAALRERFGDVFVQVYGATEVPTPITCLGKSDHAVGPATEGRLASAGRVTPGVEVAIVGDDGREVPRGETGEIRIRSRATISGYRDNPEGTAAEFERGFWKSGDLGRFDEHGYLHLVDRKKDMIVTGGFNVYAVEVEAALAAHPGVLLAAVVGIPHEEWGEAVHAEVVLREGASPTEEELVGFTKQRIGRYKAPKTVSIVAEIPTSVVGKVLRRKVREKYWQGRDRRIS